MIVQLGKVVLQAAQTDKTAMVEQVTENIAWQLPEIVMKMFNVYLEEEVTQSLGRRPYERRHKSKQGEGPEGVCSRCGTRRRGQFHRNGHYVRFLASRYGLLTLQVPQLHCACGGYVRFRFQSFLRSRRFGADLAVEIQAEYRQGNSLRQIKARLDDWLHSSVGSRTLQQYIVQREYPRIMSCPFLAEPIPPVIWLDGIWISVMFPQAEQRRDRLGRLRTVKFGRKIPLLVAIGVWPATGQTVLLGWMWAEEDQESWQTFLQALSEGRNQNPGLAALP